MIGGECLPLTSLLPSWPFVGPPKPTDGSTREETRPRWDLWGRRLGQRKEAHGAQFRLGPASGGTRSTIHPGSVPAGPGPGEGRRSQVQLMGFDVLELLPELQEGGPHGSVQVPAVLHDLIDRGWAAVGGVHLVALLHPRDDVLQGLWAGGWHELVQGLAPQGTPTQHPSSGVPCSSSSDPGLGRGLEGPQSRSAASRPPTREAEPSEAPTLPTCPCFKPHPQPQPGPGSNKHTHNSWIRHSPKGVDFPEKDPKTPHVRLGGEFLPCG